MKKFMCKNELFQTLESKNEIFKVQERKTNFIQSLRTKTIVYPKKKKKKKKIIKCYVPSLILW
jgi:hypothetical protein